MFSIPANFDRMSTGEDVADFYKDQIRGKRVLITGASPNGLGSQFAMVISKHEPELLVLAGRSLSALEQAQADILASHPTVLVRLLLVDLASLTSVRRAAAEVLAYEDGPLDVIVQNAGIMAVPEGRTVDGFETTFATNHLGPFLFLNLLLSKGAHLTIPPRIVLVSSNAQTMFGGINFDRPGYVSRDGEETYDRWAAYGQSKVANVLFASALRRRKGCEAVSLHPGVIFDSQLARSLSIDDLRAIGLVDEDGTPSDRVFAKTLSQGVATHVVAAFAPSSVLFQTADSPAPYLEDVQVRLDRLAQWTQGKEYEDRLWALSEEMAGQSFA